MCGGCCARRSECDLDFLWGCRGRVGGQERFAPWLVFFVKLQPLLQWLKFLHPGGNGKIDGLLHGLLRVGEITRFGAGHTQRVEHER